MNLAIGHTEHRPSHSELVEECVAEFMELPVSMEVVRFVERILRQAQDGFGGQNRLLARLAGANAQF